MEVKEGYRKTEVGVIPKDWEVKTLDSIAFVTSGKRLPLGQSLTEHKTPHPYIRVIDMRLGTVALTDIKFVPVEVFPMIKRYRIFKEDIFISVAGTLGIVGKVPPELNGANLTENADRITDITCSQDYLLHVLMSPLIQDMIGSLRTVGAQPKLALTRIRKFVIPLPPTEIEQIAIATVLSDMDAEIKSLEQKLAKYKMIKQGAMQELLTGKKRLPGFEGEWEVKRLGDIFLISTGRSLSKNIKEGGLYWIVDMGSISTDGRLIVSKRTNYHGDFLKIGDLVMPKDDIGGGNIIGKVAYIDAEDSYVLGDHVYCLRAKEGDSHFLSYVINGYQTNTALRRKVIGSAQLGLGRKSVDEQEIQFPHISEQIAIATVLSDMDTEIEALESKLAKYKMIKQGMMQELLTGRIRLT